MRGGDPWDLPPDHPFGLSNLPYGSAIVAGLGARVVTRIGDRALDLTGVFADARWGPLFAAGTLDRLLAAGPSVWTAVRREIVTCLSSERERARVEAHLHEVDALTLGLPFTVADYVDFYASEHHARNLGEILRPGSPPLTSNWKHLPIGYHGRAGTVVASDAEVARPSGQYRDEDGQIAFGPSRRLDFEAELGFVVGVAAPAGASPGISQLRDHVFGVCLVNDWSARDLQAWEYMPLGPFLGKSFATSAATWLTPLEALTSAWIPPPAQDPQPLPHLHDPADQALDVDLEVNLNGEVVSRPRYADMYWTPAQMLTHMTSNGATLRTGDLFASGTISGPHRDEVGSLMELTRAGGDPITLSDGTVRRFLEDGDQVTITATAAGPHGKIALGEVRGRIGRGDSPPLDLGDDS